MYNIVITHVYTIQSDHTSLVPIWHQHSYYSITDYIPCAVLYIPVMNFITGCFFFLIPFIFFTHFPSPFPPGNHQFVLCIYEFVSGLFYLFFLVCLFCFLLGWPKSPFSLFCKIKDTFFPFSPTSLLMWIV